MVVHNLLQQSCQVLTETQYYLLPMVEIQLVMHAFSDLDSVHYLKALFKWCSVYSEMRFQSGTLKSPCDWLTISLALSVWPRAYSLSYRHQFGDPPEERIQGKILKNETFDGFEIFFCWLSIIHIAKLILFFFVDILNFQCVHRCIFS